MVTAIALLAGVFTAPPTVEGQKILFSPVPEQASVLPSSLSTQLHELEVVGAFTPPEGTKLPYLLLKGRPCLRCENHPALYMIRMDGAKSAEFVFPGKIRDPKSRELVYEGRGFWGECFSKGEQGYVSFQREKVDRRRGLPNSVFVAKPTARFVEEKLMERRGPSLSSVLAQVKRKRCFEVAGVERTMMLKKIDLRPKKVEPEPATEEEESDEVKENQTEAELPSTVTEPEGEPGAEGAPAPAVDESAKPAEGDGKTSKGAKK